MSLRRAESPSRAEPPSRRAAESPRRAAPSRAEPRRAAPSRAAPRRAESRRVESRRVESRRFAEPIRRVDSARLTARTSLLAHHCAHNTAAHVTGPITPCVLGLARTESLGESRARRRLTAATRPCGTERARVPGEPEGSNVRVSDRASGSTARAESTRPPGSTARLPPCRSIRADSCGKEVRTQA